MLFRSILLFTAGAIAFSPRQLQEESGEGEDACLGMYEAETAFKNTAEFKNKKDGFFGNGYVKLQTKGGLSSYVNYKLDANCPAVSVRASLRYQAAKVTTIQANAGSDSIYPHEHLDVAKTGEDGWKWRYTNFEFVMGSGNEVKVLAPVKKNKFVLLDTMVLSSPCVGMFEAESAVEFGTQMKDTWTPYSGDGYVKLTRDGQLDFDLYACESGMYNVSFSSALSNKDYKKLKTRYLAMMATGNVGQEIGFQASLKGKHFEMSAVTQLTLSAGKNTISLVQTKKKGPMIDYMSVVKA